MKIAITGGAGFIGSHLADELSKEHEVLIIDDLSTGSQEFVPPKANFSKTDVRDPKLLEVFESFQPEVVFHLAANVDVQTSIRDPLQDASVNIVGFINLLECCRKTHVRKVIYSSTAAAFGAPLYLGIDEKHPIQPQSGYGASKYICEQYLHIYHELYGIEYVVLRYANVYGPRQGDAGEGGLISIFKKSMQSGRDCYIFGDGNQTRDFISVHDIVHANLLAMTYTNNDIFNIGTGISTSVNELYQKMARIFGVHQDPIYSEERPGDILYSYFNVEKAAEKLGFTAKIALEDGLKELVNC